MKSVKVIFIFVLISFSLLAGNSTENKESNDRECISNYDMENTSLIISGNVVDRISNETLAGVAICIDGRKIYSDLDGNFSLPFSQPGEYNLKIELISYETTEMQIELTENSNLSIVLTQK